MSGGSSFTLNVAPGSITNYFGGYFFSRDQDGVANGGAITVTASDGSTQSFATSTTATFVGFVSDAPITSLTVSTENGLSRRQEKAGVLHGTPAF